MIVVVTGETGSGKSYIARNLLPQYPNIETIQKLTTRAPRSDEDGVVDIKGNATEEEVLSLEYHYQNKMNGQYYGFSKTKIEESMEQGKIPCIIISSEETFDQLVEDFPDQVLLLNVLPYFSEETLEDIFMRQGRDTKEFEERKSSIKRPITMWADWKHNSRKISNPYFLRNCSPSIAQDVVVRRIENVFSECKADLGATLLKEDSKKSHGLYSYLYELSERRPMDAPLSINTKGKMAA